MFPRAASGRAQPDDDVKLSSILQYAILRILSEQEGHGYWLQQSLTKLRHFYPASNTNPYPLLRQLESAGCVVSRSETVSGRRRKVYSITDEGRRALDEWYGEPADPPEARDAAVLKLTLLPSDRGAVAIPWIRKERERVAELIASGEARVERYAGWLDPLSRLSADYALEVARMRIRMFEEAERLLLEADQGGKPDEPAEG